MTGTESTRPPLDRPAAEAAARAVGWRLEIVDEAPSTNHLVAERFRGGEPHGLVVVAEHQTAGRGRLGRGWVTPARTSVTASFLLVPESAQAGPWSWLPLLTGMAAARAIAAVTGLQPELKWPNDVLLEGRKLGGILIERVGNGGDAAAVVGIGLNVSQDAAELPVEEATSLSIAGAREVDRTAVLSALVSELARGYDDWHAGRPLLPAYRELCSTLGREVRVLVPGGEISGEAVDVDEDGRLVVRTAEGEEHLAAGDVVHVRAAG
jgi:BirA family biotin operon repressor/biotin-[acetyl-CoA-carboxylase] ligase